jgi:hypothetical protein
LTPSPIVSTNRESTSVVIWGFPPHNDSFLTAEAARQMAADLIRSAERVEKVEALKTQQNLKLTGPRS